MALVYHTNANPRHIAHSLITILAYITRLSMQSVHELLDYDTYSNAQLQQDFLPTI